ncbi:MAG TPA: hypothetical protein PLX66_01255 [Bacilli bacterium]|nr:hypothetical protein [Bacilli bacterium]
MKKIAVVWGITLLVVFGGLTFFGYKYQAIKDYKNLENKMEYYAEKYILELDDFKLDENGSYQVTLLELKDFRPKINFTVNNDSCDGYVIIKKGIFGYKYKAILECKNY